MVESNSTAEVVRRHMRQRLYNIASCEQFHLHDDVPANHWMQQKVDSMKNRLKAVISELANSIILVLGPPGSGKTYLVKSALKSISESTFLKDDKEWKVEYIFIEAYNHKDEIRCIKQLLDTVEKMVNISMKRGCGLSFQDVQDRLCHAMKLLKEAGIYLVIVLEGMDVLTKGSNDCSVTTGSCARRQGLLYVIGNMVASNAFSFTFICITSDIRTMERMEKRVKSRFMHDTVYCYNGDNIAKIFGSGGLNVLGPTCEVTLNSEAKMAVSEDVECGCNVTSLVASACVTLPDSAFEELDKGRVKISSEAMSSAIMHNKEKEYIVRTIEQLTLVDHHILVCLARLHVRGVAQITFVDLEEDINAMVTHFPHEKQTVPHLQGLMRAYLRLIEFGILEWVNFEYNWVGSSSGRVNIGDLRGTNASCRFSHYQLYLKMDHSKLMPSYLSVWLSLAGRTLK